MISIFKTNIENEYQIQQLKAEIDLITEEIDWSFDLEDCDKILRVDSTYNISVSIIEVLTSNGYQCAELF